MATKIKLNGTWVDVAGTSKWIGTKAELTAALAAGQIPDGTEVIVTDDYKEQEIINLTFEIPDQSLPNGESIINDVTIVSGKFYSGTVAIYSGSNPFPNPGMTLLYNDYSGTFSSSVDVGVAYNKALPCAGIPSQNILHVGVANYTGSAVALSGAVMTVQLIRLN